MTQKLPQLSIPKKSLVGDKAFDGDKLDRQTLANHLTGYIDRLREGAVLAIDAPWGEGKSYFGRNWAKALKDDGHKVVFIDAFEQDYVEDPFLLITAEISHVLDDGQGAVKSLHEKAANVMKSILPIGTKALINMAGRLALGSTDLADSLKETLESASDDMSESSKKWVEDRLAGFSLEKESLQNFREELTRFASGQDKPVILFIDELDRCKPSFAVNLVERLKHFFDVPNIVFILLLNREQLERAVKGIYGTETDSAKYLGKFVNFFFQLPRKATVKNFDSGYATEYVKHVFQKYKFTEGDHSDFIYCFANLYTVTDISLRDVEKAVALYAIALPFGQNNPFFLSYVILLKLRNPDLLSRLLADDQAAHKEASAAAEAWFRKVGDSGFNDFVLKAILQLHAAHLSGDFENVGEELKHVFKHSRNRSSMLRAAAEKIDLPIERY